MIIPLPDFIAASPLPRSFRCTRECLLANPRVQRERKARNGNRICPDLRNISRWIDRSLYLPLVYLRLCGICRGKGGEKGKRGVGGRGKWPNGTINSFRSRRKNGRRALSIRHGIRSACVNGARESIRALRFRFLERNGAVWLSGDVAPITRDKILRLFAMRSRTVPDYDRD